MKAFEDCASCIHSHWIYSCTGCRNEVDYYDIHCKAEKDKLVQGNYSSESVEPIEPPTWCPKKKKEEDTRRLVPAAKFELWNKVTPKVNWDDIKVGDIFHVPAHNGMPRHDIEVLGKSEDSFYYKKVGLMHYSNCFKRNIMAHVLVPKKNN